MEMQNASIARPGWPEVAIGLIGYFVLLAMVAAVLASIPDEQAPLRGIVGLAAGGLACTGAFIVALMFRIRTLDAFGFRAVEGKWLLIGFVLGLIAVVLSFGIEHVYFSLIIEPNTQGDFQAAAKSGVLALFLTVFAGAVLTPFGEEVLYRGAVANALNRYGPWAGILGSGVIFAAAHGPSVIFFNALMMGVLTGYLFWKTNSIWPGFVTHFVYNGIWLIIYSMQ